MSVTTVSPTPPSKDEQLLARDARPQLRRTLTALSDDEIVLRLAGEEETISVPRHALELFAAVLDAMAEGKAISVVPMEAELTTQTAAEFLGCSRPHVVKLLEAGVIPFTKVGRHRRVRYADLQRYRERAKAEQRAALIEMMRDDEADGLYSGGDDS